MENQDSKQLRGEHFKVARGVWGLKTVFVNLYMVAINQTDWVLIDTGLRGNANRILRMAETLFGGNPPKAIILTHAHFDHTGNIMSLLSKWDVPVYVHPLELPYVTGRSSYPPPDPTVGGGLMSALSVAYPYSPIDLGDRVRSLALDGSLPFLQDWIYVHTPGHAPGHIALFRRNDRLVISGDAFVSTRQESALSVAVQKKIISGPPKYFTYDWEVSRQSVKKLRELEPAIAATGHGKPMYGEELLEGLDHLLKYFDEVAIPSSGRYVNDPARTGKRGVQYIPPRVTDPMLAVSVMLLSGALAFAFARKLNS